VRPIPKDGHLQRRSSGLAAGSLRRFLSGAIMPAGLTASPPDEPALAPPESKPSVFLVHQAVENDMVTLMYRVGPPLIDPRRVLEGHLFEALAEWKKAAPEWAALAPAQRMLSDTECELAQAKEAAAQAESTWSEDLAAARDCSKSERIYTEATTTAAVMTKRREKLVETVKGRRAAAESAWRTRREQLIKDRLRKSEQVVEQAIQAMTTQPPSSFWVRVLNEEMRIIMFLKLGINGLAGICPLV
jgi:hypothetical protein